MPDKQTYWLMKKNYSGLLSALVLVAIIYGVFYTLMPQSYDTSEASLAEFSTQRAFSKVKSIAAKPHYVGSDNHEIVARFLYKELKNLGLQPEFQEGFTMTEKGTLINSKNILAKIKGKQQGKALLLLSHYDSAPHSYSHGASDDASGVAVILETLRAYLHNKTVPKNDIIILFSDAEEIGLNGAALFVTQHHWAKEVGLALNFEARGSSGPGYMLMETNEGNAQMTREFAAAKVPFPASNSLMYSIYKMLPNDTDLTVFRENGKIQGFNFAFIDSHYNYHTSQDDAAHLDKNTLAHQGSYLMPLLLHFGNADLTKLNSKEDDVYFNVPFSFVHYPFQWIWPLFSITLVLFLGFVILGLGKQVLQMPEILKGFLPLFGSIVIAGGLCFAGWKILLAVYPQYNEILHGFTYNGHDYIVAFIALTLGICFLFYSKTAAKDGGMNQLIAPLFLWLVVNGLVAVYLKGAAFLILPVLASVLLLGYFVITQKQNLWLNVLLSIPALVILVPFIAMFPVGLGLKILAGSAVLTVLTFTLLLPVFGGFSRKGIWSLLFFLIAAGVFVKAHNHSGFSKGQGKPNSLVYIQNNDTKKSYWASYDTRPDTWTKGYLGENPKDAAPLNTNKLYSKYGTSFSLMADAPFKNISAPSIAFETDSVSGTTHYYKIRITPNRRVNRYDVFFEGKPMITSFKANGVKSLNVESKISGQTTNKLLSYYVTQQLPLVMEIETSGGEPLRLNLMESSFDLMSHPSFSMAKRSDSMIPKPFVLTDAVCIRMAVKPTPVLQPVNAVSVP